MTLPTVYLDLDRTLFRTDEVGEIWHELERVHPDVIDAAKEHGRRDEFYIWSDDMYYHDVSAQLRLLGFDPADIYDELQKSRLGDGRFEYTGCHELISYLKTVANVVILTYGADEYQRFKATLCPSLRGIDLVSIVEPKPPWLRENTAAGWLVDDKPVGNDLPKSVQFVQVCHGGEKGKRGAVWPICYSLIDVRNYFKGIFSAE